MNIDRASKLQDQLLEELVGLAHDTQAVIDEWDRYRMSSTQGMRLIKRALVARNAACAKLNKEVVAVAIEAQAVAGDIGIRPDLLAELQKHTHDMIAMLDKGKAFE